MSLRKFTKLPFNGINGYVYKKAVESASFRNIRRKIYFNIRNKDRQKDDIKNLSLQAENMDLIAHPVGVKMRFCFVWCYNPL